MMLRNAGTSLGPLRGLWTMKPTHREEGGAKRWQEHGFSRHQRAAELANPQATLSWYFL